MKALGIVRKIDKLGRIVIPKEVRDSQGWEIGTQMEMFMDGNKLVLQSFGNERERQQVIKKLQNLHSIRDEKEFKKEVSNIIGHLKGVN